MKLILCVLLTLLLFSCATKPVTPKVAIEETVPVPQMNQLEYIMDKISRSEVLCAHFMVSYKDCPLYDECKGLIKDNAGNKTYAYLLPGTTMGDNITYCFYYDKYTGDRFYEYQAQILKKK